MNGIVRCVSLGAAWAFIYALPAVAIEGLANMGVEFPFTYAVDIWPAVLGLPGFIGGLIFAVLMALAGRLGQFETMPFARLAGWGALAGVLLGVFCHLVSRPNAAPLIALIFAIAVALGAFAGPGSALLFRLVARRRGSARAAHVLREVSDDATS